MMARRFSIIGTAHAFPVLTTEFVTNFDGAPKQPHLPKKPNKNIATSLSTNDRTTPDSFTTIQPRHRLQDAPAIVSSNRKG